MPTPASNRAVVVVTMMMTISFCLIGMSRNYASQLGRLSISSLTSPP